MIGIWQVIGVLPPSFHFRNWIISVDRYLLPRKEPIVTHPGKDPGAGRPSARAAE
jgi:hypothetical protein